jgi:hypothetical protein
MQKLQNNKENRKDKKKKRIRTESAGPAQHQIDPRPTNLTEPLLSPSLFFF